MSYYYLSFINMVILHLVHQYLPEYVGGTELYTRQVAEYQAQQGHEVTIFAPSENVAEPYEIADENGVRVFRVATGKRNRTTIFLNLFMQSEINTAFKLLLDDIDIIHIQHLMGLPLTVIDQIRSAGIPYIITLHDYWYICANAQLLTNYDQAICDGPDEHWRNCAKCALARAGVQPWQIATTPLAPLMRYRAHQLKPVLANAQQIIAPTYFVRDQYQQLDFGIDNITIVPHGIAYQEALITRARQEQPPHTDFHVVYIGSIAWQKGVHVLIKAFNKLPHHHFRLSVAGDLSSFPDYVEEVQIDCDHPNVTWLGRIPHESIWSLLASADVVVMPTLWYEASPLTIDEFFAAGVPIIASDLGAMREKIRDGVDGRLFPPNNATSLAKILLELAGNSEELGRLRANILPPHTIQEHLTALDQLYHETMAMAPL